MASNVDHLILVAERREIIPLAKLFMPVSDRYFEGNLGSKSVGVYVTGVGKKAVKRSAETLSGLVEANMVWNIGNVGALSPFPTGLIVRIGRVIGQNGVTIKAIDPKSPFTLVTVNSLQDKAKLVEQYPEANVVDMEASHWLEVYPNCRIIKVVLDKKDDKLRAPVRGLIWSWRIRQNAKRLTALLLNELTQS